MALRPPQYGGDAPIVYVHEGDTAWDLDRIRAERAEMLKRELDPKYHPVSRYLGGWTRYHLDAQATVLDKAVTVREYLREELKPTMWHLRRLGLREWYEVEPMWQSARARQVPPMACYLRCCEIGLVRVENGPTLELPNGRPSESDMAKIYTIGQSMPNDIGCAVYQASMPLDVGGAEGKPSG